MLIDHQMKRSSYFLLNGTRVNCDGSTVTMRKPNLKLMPNHFKPLKRFHRIFNTGQALKDGRGWYIEGGTK